LAGGAPRPALGLGNGEDAATFSNISFDRWSLGEESHA
jgi:hypothetical protein